VPLPVSSIIIRKLENIQQTFASMKPYAFYLLILGVAVMVSFSSRPAVSEQTGLITGLWKVESLKMRKAFVYKKTHSGENPVCLRFDASGTAHVLDMNTKSELASGTWLIKKSEVLISSDPFVYRDDLILNLTFGISELSIDAGDDIVLKPGKSAIDIRFTKNKTEYCAKLIRVE
jgi:hypothetical protein